MPTSAKVKTVETTIKKSREDSKENEIKNTRASSGERETSAVRKSTEGEVALINRPKVVKKVSSSKTKAKKNSTDESKGKTLKNSIEGPKPKGGNLSIEAKESKEKKCDEPEKGKKASSVIMDKAPKKSAQRTKASILIGKAAEKAETKIPKKSKRTFSSSVEQVPTLQKEDKVGDLSNSIHAKSKTQKPVCVRSKVKGGASKEDLSPPGSPKSRKPWVSVLESGSNKSLPGEPVSKGDQITKQEEKQSAEDKKPIIPSVEHAAFPSCSFFEKIQQGVRAYFSPRGSWKAMTTENDKNKRKSQEEGINLG